MILPIRSYWSASCTAAMRVPSPHWYADMGRWCFPSVAVFCPIRTTPRTPSRATFLVLVRKAASLSRPERFGNWLYGVAYRTALKARSLNARRRSEQPLADVPAADGVADLVWRELRPILDDEVNRLPEKYRVPVVLCYLEGISKREAARRLGWPDGTLSSRLHKAREILRGRLTRRSLALSAGVVALALTQGAAPAAVPVSLAAAASLVAAGRAPSFPRPSRPWRKE